MAPPKAKNRQYTEDEQVNYLKGRVRDVEATRFQQEVTVRENEAAAKVAPATDEETAPRGIGVGTTLEQSRQNLAETEARLAELYTMLDEAEAAVAAKPKTTA